MPISLTINSDTPDGLLADIRTLFPSALPPMQEQPVREPAPMRGAPTADPTADPKPERKTRTKKTEELPPESVKPVEAKTEASGEQRAPDTSASEQVSTDASSKSSEKSPSSDAIPDIEDLRARLKTLGATEGFGTDKVFEVLGRYGAKNASTVPEEKRAACIAEIDELLKGGK